MRSALTGRASSKVMASQGMPCTAAILAIRLPYAPLIATNSFPLRGITDDSTDSTANVPEPCISTTSYDPWAKRASSSSRRRMWLTRGQEFRIARSHIAQHSLLHRFAGRKWAGRKKEFVAAHQSDSLID